MGSAAVMGFFFFFFLRSVTAGEAVRRSHRQSKAPCRTKLKETVFMAKKILAEHPSKFIVRGERKQDGAGGGVWFSSAMCSIVCSVGYSQNTVGEPPPSPISLLASANLRKYNHFLLL